MQEQAVKLSVWEQSQAKFARHRALILQILNAYPDGLAVQAIIALELEWFGFSFLTDNRLRELRCSGFVESFGENPQKWRLKKVET